MRFVDSHGTIELAVFSTRPSLALVQSALQNLIDDSEFLVSTMASALTSRTPSSATSPVLEHGDRLTVREFRQRYESTAGLKKAELIAGVVYMQAAVRATHGEPHANLLLWLSYYRSQTPLTVVGDNTTLRISEDSEPQPDCYLRIDEAAGGQSRVVDDYLVGAPELVAEVALSSASYDLHDKLKVYEKNGVQEYIVWRVEDREIDWFVLTDGRFQRTLAGDSRRLKSSCFPGLWLDVAALIEDQPAVVLEFLQQGLAAPEHAAFIETLKSAK